jgi:GNAT superfamily N-acetyltransferase
LAELESHTHALNLPTTLIAVEAEQLLGSASLILEDLPESELLAPYSSLSPWLASVYVIPSKRGQGVGRALVTAIEHHAQKLNIPQLYLFTENQAAFYDRLGWSQLAQVPHQQQTLTIMSKTFGS